MARFTSVNTIPATGAVAMYTSKTVMKSAGWTVPRSSDGTTYSAVADVITSGASGAGGWANNSAWAVVREPGSRRSWCWQRGTANTSWRVKYSPLAGFTGGSPGATQVPSATDEQVLIGGGSDAAPSFSAVFATDGTYRVHCVAESTAVNGAYFFATMTTVNPTGAISALFAQDPIVSGSGPTLDGDPAVVLTRVAGGGSTRRGYVYFGTASESFVALTHQSPGPFPAAHMTDPGSSDITIRSMWATSTYWKGVSAFMRCKGTNRDYPDTVNVATDAHVYWDNFLVPWETGTAPQL